MYDEFCQDCPTVIHDEYEYDFFCTEENGEYVTEDLETIVTTEEIVRSLFYNEDRFDKIHIFMNRKRHVINDLFPREDGCKFLSRLRMCSDDEKERMWKIVRTREVNR